MLQFWKFQTRNVSLQPFSMETLPRKAVSLPSLETILSRQSKRLCQSQQME
jgi:hypothetical protein